MRSFSHYIKESEDFKAVVHYTDPEGKEHSQEVSHPVSARTGVHEFVKKLPKGSKLVKTEYP